MYLIINLILLFLLSSSKLVAVDTSYGLSGNWWKIRDCLHEKGIDIKPSLYLDTTWNLDGGKKQTYLADSQYLFELICTVESDPLFHYEGGLFYFDFSSHHGVSPSEKDVGSIVAVDVLEAPPFDMIYACWYKQTFDDFWILFGKSDAYDVGFTYIIHAKDFINDGYTFPYSILLFPSYPNPSLSLVGSFTLFDVTWQIGAYKISPLPKTEFIPLLDNSCYFLIGELGVDWELGSAYAGHFGIGLWGTRGKILTFKNTIKRSTSGCYITFDQILYKKAEEEIGFFLMYGACTSIANLVKKNLVTGVEWKGILPKRADDSLGVGISTVFLSRKDLEFTKSYETACEIYYLYQFEKWGMLQPDFQYIIHPGGGDLPNATVVTLRLLLHF